MPSVNEPVPAALTARFQAARERLLSGDLAGAAIELEGVAADPLAGGLAERAAALARLARDLAARGRFVPFEPTSAPETVPVRERKPDRGGRAELVLFSTLYGVYAAGATALAADVDNGRVLASLLLAGGGAGLGTSIWLTRTGPISSGRADAIDSSAVWTGFNGTILGVIGEASFRVGAGISLGTSLAGLTTAALLTRERAPPAGTVAATNSGGIWGLAAGAFVVEMIPGEDLKAHLGGMLLLADAGLAAGAWLGDRYGVSRERALLIDAGAVVGVLAGLAARAIVDSDVRELNASMSLTGLGAGLGTAIWATRDWDERPTAKAAAIEAAPWVTPLPDGRIAWGVAGRF